MARKTKEESQKTRANILEAAVIIFNEKGVARASLEDIAKQADVTRGAVYWHFKNKINIFEALQEELHSSLVEAILGDLERAHPRPLEQLEHLCTELIIEIQTNMQKHMVLKIFFMKCDYAGDMEYLLTAQNAQKQKHLDLFAHYFKKAQDKGHLPADDDPKVLSKSLSCFLTGIVFEHMRAPEQMDLTTLAPQLMKGYFKSYHCTR